MISTLRLSSSLQLLSLLLAGNESEAQLPSPPPSHIVVVIEENYSYSQIIGSGPSVYAPYINDLCATPYSAVFTNSWAIEHPSEPNYLDLYSGQNQGTTGSDGYPAGVPFTTPNLGAQLLAAGKTFETYSEDMPSPGYDGSNIGLYWRKHNPCQNWVVATGTPGTNQYGPSINLPYVGYFPVSTNYASLPTVSFLVPNSVNDMHDGSYPSNIPPGDNWFHTHVDTLLNWALANNTLVILTFDEGDVSLTNQIPTIFYGPMVKGGTYSELINHYNVLRTIENLYGLSYIGNAASATTITDCWRASGTGPWLGISNNPADVSFTAYPNPASGQVTFACDGNRNTTTSITVTDPLGRMAGQYEMTGNLLKINTGNYAPGLYIFKAISDDNSIVKEGKFIIAQN